MTTSQLTAVSVTCARNEGLRTAALQRDSSTLRAFNAYGQGDLSDMEYQAVLTVIDECFEMDTQAVWEKFWDNQA